MRLEDKVALVTGAASGMGASMARIFAREGAKVVVADVLEEEGRRVVADITQANGAAIFRRLDVASEAEWKATVEATLAEFQKLDILVNDAGLSGSAVEDLFDTAAWDRLMAVNARGVFLGMKFAIPIMKAAGGGSIVNISSISGITGQHGIHVGYNASKGAVRTLTKAAAVQHGADNIRVNSVHPGLMLPMRSSGRTADPEVRAQTLRQVPLGRAGRVEEVANAVLFLASTRRLTSPAPSSGSTAALSPVSAAARERQPSAISGSVTTRTPAASRPRRAARATMTPVGSSPCTHSVSRWTFSRLPVRETISSFRTMLTTRSVTTSGSLRTEPGTLREVRLPSSS
jgi:NAD(P)-dependent dehydrogenase (short-subunit alcohol dehydrogenase family)